MLRKILNSVMLVVAVTAPLQNVVAASATIDLRVNGPDRVVTGAFPNIYSYVANSAAPGSNDLNYSIEYAYPNGSTATLTNQTRVAGAGPGTPYVGSFDSAQKGLGTQKTKVTVTDPAATNSPFEALFNVNVLAHAEPWACVTVPGRPAVVAQAPSVDPLAFGATGGGESFAARWAGFNDPPGVPTAKLDLDTLTENGDSQIRAAFYSPAGTPQTMSEFISSFKNLTEIHEATGMSQISDPALYQQYGRYFDIYVDTSKPGTYVKTWFLGFSDEDIPGAAAPGTITRTFSITATVSAVPLPAAAWLFGSGLVGVLGSGLRYKSRAVVCPA